MKNQIKIKITAFGFGILVKL